MFLTLYNDLLTLINSPRNLTYNYSGPLYKIFFHAQTTNTTTKLRPNDKLLNK